MTYTMPSRIHYESMRKIKNAIPKMSQISNKSTELYNHSCHCNAQTDESMQINQRRTRRLVNLDTCDNYDSTETREVTKE
jgi:hypothetical protein